MHSSQSQNAKEPMENRISEEISPLSEQQDGSANEQGQSSHQVMRVNEGVNTLLTSLHAKSFLSFFLVQGHTGYD